jgi:hypothetical protein
VWIYSITYMLQFWCSYILLTVLIF